MNKAGGIKLTTVALAVVVMAVSAFINTSKADDQVVNQSVAEQEENQ
ncbi:hypothetical protein [Catenovulum adriaticum]|uniref:Uncharacterized protein n=1 Tax=Catenovulum adriaticum TaxID=2984846 RepID=A0ABY7ARL0_9ALTE|nr:hypothetical protein [Catenovulum sp. TS8]WAJ71125.1 hypothetical protein OLW01_04775 [Catenovulum sp. TS8]